MAPKAPTVEDVSLLLDGRVCLVCLALDGPPVSASPAPGVFSLSFGAGFWCHLDTIKSEIPWLSPSGIFDSTFLFHDSTPYGARGESGMPSCLCIHGTRPWGCSWVFTLGASSKIPIPRFETVLKFPHSSWRAGSWNRSFFICPPLLSPASQPV